MDRTNFSAHYAINRELDKVGTRRDVTFIVKHLTIYTNTILKIS
jgi:hypothetical protein